MISEQVSTILKTHIQEYDKKCGKDYLLLFSLGKKRKKRCCEITFKHYNYWHLLGCEAKSEDTFSTYLKCKKGLNISREVKLRCDLFTFYEKERSFNQVFDFVKKAKSIKLGYIDIGPECFQLTMAIGNNMGIIGYDFSKTDRCKYLFPKSCQAKLLKNISTEPNKILMILSKDSNKKTYTTLEYEIKKGVSEELIKELSEEILIELI